MGKALNLVLHAGAAAVPAAEVFSVQTPAPSADWFPIAHGQLIGLVRDYFTATGLTIVAEQHALTSDGARYFGLLQVAGNNADYDLVVGLRNTHDQSYAAGLCVGSGVFVCDNLAFSSEIVLGRKHTRYIERDLPQLVYRAVGKLIEYRGQQDRRLAAYKDVGLDDRAAYAAIIELLKARAIVNADVARVVGQWDKPKYEDFAGEHNVWRLFNAVTTAARPGLGAVVRRTQTLHGVCDRLATFSGNATQAIIGDAIDAEVEVLDEAA